MQSSFAEHGIPMDINACLYTIIRTNQYSVNSVKEEIRAFPGEQLPASVIQPRCGGVGR
jgi:hypothetical protein